MTYLSRVVTAALSAVACAAHAGVAQYVPLADNCFRDETIRVYIPAFTAPGGSQLGINASTLINLAVVKTLREAPNPNPQHLDFGRGCVVWTLNPLSAASRQGASIVDVANTAVAQMVLDGEAFPYGTGAVVTARLYMTPRGGPNDLSKVWRIEFNAALLNGADSQKRAPLELVEDAIPEREFEFRSVALMGDDLKAYSSPDLVDVHENAPTGRVIGHIGDGFRALRQEATSAEVLTYARLHGYIVTPVPRPEIVAMGNYVGGVVRVLRSDWAGALELLLGQTEKSPLPVSLSVDALLMSAYCRERSDREGLSLVTRAAALSPSAPRVLKYRLMVLLSEIVREAQRGDSATIQGLVRDYESAVDALGVALGREDTWVRQAHAIQIALAHQNPAPPT